MKRTDFLDVVLDLSTGRTAPYKKPMDNPLHVHKESSHPDTILRQIPLSVGERLSKLSSSRQEFDSAKPVYENALKQAGYDGKLEYKQPREPSHRRNRKRKTLWFTPPFSAGVRGNLTQMFTGIIQRAFPKNHAYLNKLFNVRNLRLSYSTMPNLDKIIARHNNKIMREYRLANLPPRRLCNCRANGPECPMDGQCLKESMVYRADVLVTGAVNETRFYLGQCGGKFKTRYGNHLKSLRHERYKDETALSSYIWDAQRRGGIVSIKWSIVAIVPAHRPGERDCGLCLAEKAAILNNAKDPRCLNKRGELFSKCRHRLSSLLATVGD